MKQELLKLLNYFMPEKMRGKENDPEFIEEYKKIQLVLTFSLILSTFPTLMFFVRVYMEGLQKKSILLLPTISVCMVLLAFYIKKTGKYKAPILIFMFLASMVVFLRVISTGGMSSSVIFWFSFAPAMSGLLLKGISKAIANGAVFLFLLTILSLEKMGYVPTYEPSSYVRFAVVAIGLLALIHITEIYDRYRESFFTLIKKTNKMSNEVSKMESLSKMSAGVAHEINNPLQIINGNVERIRYYLSDKSKSKEDINLVLDKILKTSERIEKITSAMRIYAKEGIYYEISPFDLKDSIEKFYIKNKLIIFDKGINLYCKNLEKLTLIPGNVFLINEILTRVIDNSVEELENFVNPAEKWIKIDVELNKNILITVTDNGGGVSLENDSNIMEPFFSTKGVEYSGLGLSLTQGYCDYLDWTFYYNKLSEHTQFCIEIPYDESNEALVQKAA